MNILSFTRSISGVTFVGLSSIYISILLYLFYCYFRGGRVKFRLLELVAAVVSFLLMSVQQEAIPFFINECRMQASPLILIPIKLFILSTVFVVMLLQSSGLIKEGITLFIRHLCRLYMAILVADLLYVMGIMGADLHIMAMLGMTACVIMLLLLKFFRVYIKACDYLKEGLTRENLMKFTFVSCVVLVISYTLFMSVFFREREALSIVPLTLLLSVQISFFIYWSRNGVRPARYGVPADSRRDDQEKISAAVLEDKGSDYQDIIDRLVLCFENEKPYLNCDLKIEDVARRIYTNKTYVSRALNHGMSKNFNQFVNGYRIREACSIYIHNPVNSISELCDKCGFKNLSSFSTAFSLHVGYTPAEWCREVKKKLVNNEKVSVDDYFS